MTAREQAVWGVLAVRKLGQDQLNAYDAAAYPDYKDQSRKRAWDRETKKANTPMRSQHKKAPKLDSKKQAGIDARYAANRDAARIRLVSMGMMKG